MKRTILISLLVCFYAGNVFAAHDLDVYFKDVKGPVKKITINKHEPGGNSVLIYWYDSIGRLAEYAYYDENGHILEAKVRQYSINNTYMDYHYNDKGIIMGNFERVQMDSMGNILVKKYYLKGKHSYGDSLVYNEQGKVVGNYDWQDGMYKLEEVYEYDSLGMLSMHLTFFQGKEFKYTIEYLPDGSYIEHHSEKNGKEIRKWDEKYTVNKEGWLIKIKSREKDSRFSGFDKYGNWTFWDDKSDLPIGYFHSTYNRTIEYYEE